MLPAESQSPTAPSASSDPLPGRRLGMEPWVFSAPGLTFAFLRWHIARKSECTAQCGLGYRTLEIYCSKYSRLEGKIEKVDDRFCSSQPKPSTREKCTGDCNVGGWRYSAWTEVRDARWCGEHCLLLAQGRVRLFSLQTAYIKKLPTVICFHCFFCKDTVVQISLVPLIFHCNSFMLLSIPTSVLITLSHTGCLLLSKPAPLPGSGEDTLPSAEDFWHLFPLHFLAFP